MKRFTRKMRVVAFIVQYISSKVIYKLRPRLPKASRVFAQQFPAVPLQPDRITHIFNFSSELLVGLLVVIVAGFNIAYFGLSDGNGANQDNSLAAKLLSYHDDLNPELYAHQNSVRTVVVSRGFIAEASADETAETEAESNDDGTTVTFDINIEDNAIVKPNAGRIQGLVNIEVYKTQPGDTLGSIAQQFGISTNTLKWSNELTSDTIKPGWFLRILPVDGVLVKVGDNTTLRDIEKKYNGNLQEIMAYNGLDDELGIEPGDLIICKGCSITPTPIIAAKPSSTSGTSGSIIPRRATVGHIFASGHCTDYVARRYAEEDRPIPWGGNANRWGPNSKPFGATVDKNPERGAILITTDSRYGHVAYIESVDGNTVTISEWNYAGLYKKTVRELSMNDRSVVGVIHYNP